MVSSGMQAAMGAGPPGPRGGFGPGDRRGSMPADFGQRGGTGPPGMMGRPGAHCMMRNQSIRPGAFGDAGDCPPASKWASSCPFLSAQARHCCGLTCGLRLRTSSDAPARQCLVAGAGNSQRQSMARAPGASFSIMDQTILIRRPAGRPWRRQAARLTDAARGRWAQVEPRANAQHAGRPRRRLWCATLNGMCNLLNETFELPAFVNEHTCWPLVQSSLGVQPHLGSVTCPVPPARWQDGDASACQRSHCDSFPQCAHVLSLRHSYPCLELTHETDAYAGNRAAGGPQRGGPPGPPGMGRQGSMRPGGVQADVWARGTMAAPAAPSLSQIQLHKTERSYKVRAA